MHITRQHSSLKLPIPRKGTKYIARAFSHKNDGLPVLIAVRDMLHLAKTAREVKAMVQQKVLKINGNPIKDYHETIRLFNIFEADKPYQLTLLRTGRFSLIPAKDKESRWCKIINKRLMSPGIFQLNFHDGTNLITKENFPVGDTIVLDLKGKIKKHIAFEKGKKIFVYKGKYQGLEGEVSTLEGNSLVLAWDDKKTSLDKRQAMVL